MLDTLVLVNILQYVSNPWDFINLMIAILDPLDAIQKIEYFKKTREFQELVWMFNCGRLARFAFSSVDDNHVDYMRIKGCNIVYHFMYDYDYYEPRLDIIINERFFTEISLTYFQLWLSGYADEHEQGNADFYTDLNNVFGFDVEKLDLKASNTNQTYVKALDAKFGMLYNKYPNAFSTGFNSGSRRMNLHNCVMSIQQIDNHVRKEIYGPQPFVSQIDGLTEKENYHSSNKQCKRSKFDNKKKEKRKQKHRSSPKCSQRKLKYSGKLDYFA